MTSRSWDAAFELVGSYDKIVKIEAMNENDALMLFRQKLGDDSNNADVLELLKSLDYMLLAIIQAAAYIR